MSSTGDTEPFTVAAFYRFSDLPRFAALRAPLQTLCAEHSIKGTVLLAAEGINGTVAGRAPAIDALLAWLGTVPEFDGAEIKFSEAAAMPFLRMKVRLKREIVTMGVEGLDPRTDAGIYVDPDEWNSLIADDDTIVVDTRNDYEVSLGRFRGALNPNTKSFREFPEWVQHNHNRLAGKKVALYCTGGIRCEKATAYVRSLGINEVFHLKGGILRYLEDVAPEKSLWDGECFVFDERVTVGHGLAVGDIELCRACRHPLTPDERASPDFIPGVACPYCRDTKTEAQRQRYLERHRQVQLARKRGGRNHIGN